MLLIVLYHYLEVNAVENTEDVVLEKNKVTTAANDAKSGKAVA